MKTKKLVWSGVCLALALLLPFVTGQIPEYGNMLLPMHLPVLLCGFVCGYQYGLLVGFIAPLLRYALFGMPPVLPIGIPMAFELATYGCVTGLLGANKEKLSSIYITLIVAMLSGRIVWALVRLVLLGINGTPFTISIFLASAFTNAIPGIIIQLIIIPILVNTLRKAKLI